MRYPIYIFLFITIFSCTNNSNTAETYTDTHTSVPTQPSTKKENTPEHKDDRKEENQGSAITGCYVYILQRDTMVAHLKQSGSDLSGKLTFDNYQKDGSSGNVKGRLEGDVLKLIYSFQSEGMNSVMEVYFKKTADGLVRATGNMETKYDTAYFKNPQSISYPSKTEFKKQDCATIAGKYK